jgi:hypothetical protein
LSFFKPKKEITIMPKETDARVTKVFSHSNALIRPFLILQLLLWPLIIVYAKSPSLNSAKISAAPISSHFGPQQTISANRADARSVHAADLDMDGDPDVLAASRGNDEIVWYENLNGTGTFGPANEIATASYSDPYSVVTADLDKDGDLDVLAALGGPDEVVWYENTLDKNGSFGPKQLINEPDSAGAYFISIGDMDGDNNPDVLVAHQGEAGNNWAGSKIYWYENRLAESLSWNPHAVDSSVNRAQSVFAAYIDGDDDLDFLAALAEDNEIVWYENVDGTGTSWTKHIISSTANFAVFVTAVDVDKDNDLDVLSASTDDHNIIWYENTDADVSAWTPHLIDTLPNITQPNYLIAQDLDNDKDPDLIVASFWVNDPAADSQITVYENIDGAGSFVLKQIIVTQPAIQAPHSLDTADLDKDGHLDLLSASAGDNKIAWYKSFPYATFVPAIMNNFCRKFLGTMESEPNDTASQANGCLESGAVYTGNSDEYGSNQDNDYYYFYVSTTGTITIDLTNFLDDGQLQLYYQSTADLIDYDRDKANGHYQITHNGTPGLYYIRVVSIDDHATGNGNYSLQVTYPK